MFFENLSKRYTFNSILSFRATPVVVSLGMALSACGLESGGTVQAAGSATGKTCGVMTEPGTGRLLLGAEKTQIVDSLALGLAVVDGNGIAPKQAQKVGCDKDIVIFVHGWSQGGTPTEFAHPDLWQKRGFQTLVFRWHDISGSSFEPVFVTNSRIAVTRFEKQLRELYGRLGRSGFQHEIRLVGHSFGAKVATEVTSRIGTLVETNAGKTVQSDSEELNGVPISRLTMLDSAVFADWNNSEWSLCPLLRLGLEPAAKGVGNENSQNADPVTEEANRTLAVMSMLPPATKVEVFSTNVASAFSYSLANRFAVQTLTKSTAFGCFIRFDGLDMVQVHKSVVAGYFSSIVGPAPRLEGDASTPGRELLSAAVPTSKMVTKPGWYVLKEGDPRKDWGRQVFVKKNIPNEYLKVELGNKCTDSVAGTDDCSIGAKFVKKF
jgi:pimeloyl-ACP methyl ester carboxylesterase